MSGAMIEKKDSFWVYNGISFSTKKLAEQARSADMRGEEKIREEDFAGGKQRISMWVDESVVGEYKKIAADRGTKYQTLMNEVLKNYLGDGERRIVDMKESEFRKFLQSVVGS